MAKCTFGVAMLSIIVLFSYVSGHASSSLSGRHYTNLVVGGGSAGLYTAWRLSSSKNESTAVFEWSPTRLGGRVLTKPFPGGQYLELGAMRFKSKHLLLMQVLRELNLTDHITNFTMTDNRLYYLRGEHVYQKEISKKGVPYNTIYRTKQADHVFEEIARKMNPMNENYTRAQWCKYFDQGLFPANVTSNAFKENDILGNIGYWNLIMDQFDHEAVSYAADAEGFKSDVLNSNAAYSVFYNSDFGSSNKYLRLKMGFSQLIYKLKKQCLENQVQINNGQRLTKFHWNTMDRKFYSTFTSYDENGTPSGDTLQVTSDRLFLCVPKRSLDLIQETDVVGNDWPANTERRVLQNSAGKVHINSVIQKPAYKIGLIYDYPWWLNATYKPFLNDSSETYEVASEKNYGPTVTDLPLQNIFYFGDNKFRTKPVYGVLGTYGDMRNTYFWEGLELSPDESFWHNQNKSIFWSSFLHPLFSGTKVTDVMHKILREQLNSVHYKDSTKLQVPPAIGGYFMNWGRDPYGAGYHGWKAHYKIAEAQYYMTTPSEAINVFSVPLHIAGEAYSIDQSWVEGAFTTAESILVDKIGLNPLLTSPPNEYPLICRPEN